MADPKIRPKELLLFEIDTMTQEAWFVAIKPEGYNVSLVFSPYFINRLVSYAIKFGILEIKNDKSNQT